MVMMPGPLVEAVDDVRGEDQDVPVILLTPPQPGVKLHPDGPCAAGHLTKPLRQSDLERCLSHLDAADAAGAEGPGRTRPAPLEPVSGPGAVPAGLRVLVAEDDAVNQRVALRMLESLGCRVDLVPNGREAVEAVNRRTYDFVLLDCQMPVLDGFAAAAAIGAAGPRPARPVIVAITADALQGDRERCLAAGMDDYLPKPIRLRDLAEVLLRWSAS